MFSAKPAASEPFFQCQGDLFYAPYDPRQPENKGPFRRLDKSPIPCEQVVSKLTQLCKEERFYSAFYNVSLKETRDSAFYNVFLKETGEDGISDSRGINSRDLCRSTPRRFSCAMELAKDEEYTVSSRIFEKCWGLKGYPHQESQPKE